ncbi:uncharacterized protein LOC108810197 isoform X2 [Raphanus sativus]|uniref:Uncharacterized protein LOC108810197 isoform X2 n=1 Tax=Raphanus sativus TaxID=3726 RepID=A0A9W3BZS5_RAPSA|nr:uncharacterized protein LOC108810197 isoform X2 [Raphanus sativus]
MARDHEGRINTAKTATLQKIMKFRMEQQQIHEEHMQQRRSRLSRDEYKPRGYDQLERNQKHAVVIKDTPQQRRFERDKWSRDCSQPSETKLYPSISSQKLEDSRRSRPSTGIVSTKKKPICASKEKTVSKPFRGDKQYCLFSEKDKEALLQVMMDVERQFKRSNKTRAAIETQHQEPATTVSDLKDTEPESAAPIQEDQAKVSSPINQKEEQPVQDIMVPFIQTVVEEETPKEPQADHGMMQLIVFDPSDFQRTFLGTFLINPFIWSKTRAVELSRHELGLKNVVFEPGGELWHHRNNTIMIEKKSVATTLDFGDLLLSGDKVLHVSGQQEFHYETNWRILPTQSLIQRTRPRSKWPPDLQVITSLAKYVGLDQFQEMFTCDWVGRLQTYLWKPGAYFSIFIFLGEHSARARISWGHKELQPDHNVLLLDHVKIWKPPDMQQLQYPCRDYQTMIGDEGVTGEIGKVITGPGEELMFSSQIKEKPPDQLILQHTPKKPTRGIHLNSKKNMIPDLLAVGTGQTVLRSTFFEKRGYNYQGIKDESLAKLEMQQANLESCLAASLDIGAVRGPYLNNHKELFNKLDCYGNLTHEGLRSNWNRVQSFSGERVMGSTSRVILCVLCLNFSEFRTSQSYLWRPGEHAKSHVQIIRKLGSNQGKITSMRKTISSSHLI